MESRYRAFASLMIMLAATMFLSPAIAQVTPEWKCTAQGDVPLDERIAACTSILDSGKFGRPGIIRAYLNRANAHNKKGEFERAVADYSAFLELYPANMFAYACRAYSYFQLGDFDRAIADYDRAVELNQRSRYAYFSRGVAYYRKGDYDHAIADYTQALQLGHQDRQIPADRKAQPRDRDPTPPPVDGQATSLASVDGHTLYTRGVAYYAKGDLDRAIADYDQAILLDSRHKNALAYRATAYKAKGKLDRAIEDYDQIVRIDPQDARVHRARAMVYWQSGSFAKSLTDLDTAIRLAPKDAYSVLWREIVAKRDVQPSQLTETAAQLDMTKWPAPIVSMFLGGMTPEQVLAAADDSDPKKKACQECEANFYAGELALQQGSKEDALRLFDLAAADCPKGFVEKHAASVELGVLRANH